MRVIEDTDIRIDPEIIGEPVNLHWVFLTSHALTDRDYFVYKDKGEFHIGEHVSFVKSPASFQSAYVVALDLSAEQKEEFIKEACEHALGI